MVARVEGASGEEDVLREGVVAGALVEGEEVVAGVRAEAGVETGAVWAEDDGRQSCKEAF